MRLPRRIIPLKRAIVATVLLVVGSLPSQVFAQSAPQLPAAWSNAVDALANKIAAAAAITQPIWLDVKNISSISPSDAGAARQAIEADLTQRRFRLASSAPAQVSGAATQVRVTFSEGVEGLVWVAEIQAANGSDNERQVAIVAVAKPTNDISRGAQDSLTLDKKLIWEQPDVIVDFATIPQSAGASSTLLILEPSRLVFYRSPDAPSDAELGAQWQLWEAVTIVHSSTRTRDVFGHIDIASQKVSLPGVECAGDFQQPETLKCTASTRQSSSERIEASGHEASAAADLAAKCSGASVMLATGTGDWTQPDSIQGFELANSQAQPIAAGDPIATDGPVISLAASPKQSDARAVVYNLKTGHYEGYVVTATCNH